MRKELARIVQKQLNLLEADLVKLDSLLAAYSKGQCSVLSIWKSFETLIYKYPANSLIILRLLDFLQLINDSDFLQLYSLKDIQDGYEKLAAIYKDDMDVNMENYYFIYNIVDDEKKALKFKKNLQKRVDKKLLK